MESVVQQGAAYTNNDMKPLLVQKYTNKGPTEVKVLLFNVQFYINMQRTHAHASTKDLL